MRVLLFVSALCLAAVACQAESINYDFTEGDFAAWAQHHGKQYATDAEFNHREQVFIANLKKVAKMNAESNMVSFGANKFADLTHEEFSSQYLNAKQHASRADDATNVQQNLNIQRRVFGNNSTYVNWQTAGAITAVKDQGQCGSCWAFSATEEVESMWYMAGNDMTELSPQQVVSCDTNGSDQGCNGGLTEGAYEYVQKAGGLTSESAYPYTSGITERDGTCTFGSSTPVVASITGYTYAVPKANFRNDKDACSQGSGMMNALQQAPISVCVDASSWQLYRSGVLPLSKCGSSTLGIDHCVQLTGYNMNTQDGNNYWIVRNSWASSWGNDGFIFLEMGADGNTNTCSVCSDATFATI